MFDAVAEAFPKIDFLVHAIGFAQRSQIGGSFIDNADRAAFLQAMDVSVYSCIEARPVRAKMMGRAARSSP